MTDLGVSRFKQILHAKKIKQLIRQFIDGLIPTDQTLAEILSHCRKNVTVYVKTNNIEQSEEWKSLIL